MKFLLRCLLVLAAAAAFSATLYLAVQALPGGTPSNPPTDAARPGVARTTPEAPAPRPEGSQSNRKGGIGLRSLLQVARRIVVFSVLVFFSVLAKNFVFERKPNRKKTAG